MGCDKCSPKYLPDHTENNLAATVWSPVALRIAIGSKGTSLLVSLCFAADVRRKVSKPGCKEQDAPLELSEHGPVLSTLCYRLSFYA